MPKRADKVRAAVRAIHERGEYPSPGRIQAELGETVTHNINGRDCKAREAEFIALGYEYQEGKMFGRTWRRPNA